MRIIMLRHGETDWNVCGRIQGSRDVPLNHNGVRQMKEACESFLDSVEEDFSFIVTSPRLRSRQSAGLCSSWLNIPYHTDRRFREREFGILEGKDHKEIMKKYGVIDPEALDGNRWGLEPISECRHRVKTGICDLIEKYPLSNILIITHGSVMHILMKEEGLISPFISFLDYQKIPSNGQAVEVNVSQFIKKEG